MMRGPTSGIVLQDDRLSPYAPESWTAMQRIVTAPIVLLGGMSHTVMWALVWVAGEVWALLHLFFGIPLVLACFAALLGLWCLYLAIQTTAGFVRGLYLRLLLRSAQGL